MKYFNIFLMGKGLNKCIAGSGGLAINGLT